MGWLKHYMCYELTKDFSIQLPFACKFYKSHYIEALPDGELKINKGYRWNGCSPKFEIFDIVIGTPEGVRFGKYSKTYHPSLVHDALYQAKCCTRKQADKVFLALMGKTNFKLRYIYWLVVRILEG